MLVIPATGRCRSRVGHDLGDADAVGVLGAHSPDQQVGADRRQGRNWGIWPLRIWRMNSAVGL